MELKGDVSFFFVLSGFIMAYNYQDRLLDGAVSRRTFWVARFARIYPLHWLTLLAAAGLGGYVIAADGMDWVRHFVSAATLTNAYIPRGDYFFLFNSPSWSLCCEQLFYVLFPFVVVLNKRPWRFLCLWGVIALFMIAGMGLTPAEHIKGYWYVNPVTRFPDFVLGMLLYVWYGRVKDAKITPVWGSVSEVAAVALFLAFYMGADAVPKVYRYSCYYWLPIAVMIGVFSLQRGWLSRLLAGRILVVGGEISYSFYLIHLFFLLTYAEWSKRYGWDVAWYISVPVLFVVIVALSYVVHRYFEKPVNKWIKSTLNK